MNGVDDHSRHAVCSLQPGNGRERRMIVGAIQDADRRVVGGGVSQKRKPVQLQCRFTIQKDTWRN